MANGARQVGQFGDRSTSFPLRTHNPQYSCPQVKHIPGYSCQMQDAREKDAGEKG